MNLGNHGVTPAVQPPITINTSKNDVVTSAVFIGIVLNVLDRLSSEEIPQATKKNIAFSTIDILNGDVA